MGKNKHKWEARLALEVEKIFQADVGNIAFAEDMLRKEEKTVKG